ncbi:MAG: hypothetical protein HY422_02855 [Candidatus Komeilibacteria bacterium]|nr:hypothetical protein [Candidatus Komeilibacteria bacterium]
MKPLRTNNAGTILIQVLTFGVIALVFLGGIIAWAGSNIRLSKLGYQREVTIEIAEAGIEYYRWRLVHDPTDFQDGTNQPGPYVHQYDDVGGNRIGEFSLTITPPAGGSNTAIVRSTGILDGAPAANRTIEVVLSQPSLASYAVIGNTDLYFAENVTVNGRVHANGGIRFDGVANGLVTSALSSYADPSHTGENEFAVHTHVPPIDPSPPAAVPTRADVFAGGRQFPAPAFDFDGITEDLANIKAQAQLSGTYLPNSGSLGYHLILKKNDTIDVYAVTSLVPPPSVDCADTLGQSGWGTWSIATETLSSTIPLPANGALFIEDDLWIDGQIDTAQLTIGAARFPENPTTYANVTINSDLLYTNYNGSDIIGIIAQNNIHTGLVSADVLHIDAALVAKKGRVGRYYYPAPYCSPYDTRLSLTLFGLIASNGIYGTRYNDGNGYQNRSISYDANLLYAAPPYFPSTETAYDLVQWREIR